MNARTLLRSALMAAMALSFTVPALAQEGTGDPFLDAMIDDQQKQTPSTATPTRQPQDDAPATPAVKKPGDRPSLISETADTTLVDDEVVKKELGEGTGLFSQDQVYEGKRVNSVRIRYISGTPTVPDARLLDLISTTKGSTYSASVINDDLERLIRSGLISGDAQVAVEASGSGVNVIFEVRPANVLGGVGFTGNTRFSDNRIRKELQSLHFSSVINDRDLAAARAAIVKMYYEAGYPDTKVTWRHVGTARKEYSDVIFDIVEGREVAMISIDFVGNHQFDSQQLRQMMKIQERGIFTFFTNSGRVQRQQLEDDLQEIIRRYRNYGYLRARITKVEYADNGKATGCQKLYMKIHLDEGPRYRVRHVSFSQLSIYTPEQLQAGLSMLDGDIYSLQKVKDDVTMIRKYCGAKGYADADVRPDINEVGAEADGTRLVDICYRVHEGTPYKVGRVNVRGNTITKSHVILRELPVKPGQALNAVDLETARKRLDNLNYFSSVEISQAASGTPGYRDVNINVQEQQTGNVFFGISFSSMDSFAVFANITQSNFDIRGLFGGGSFRGGGQHLSISSRLGFETQSVSVFLLEPWFLDRKLAFGNEVFFSNSSYMSDYYTQKNFGYEVSLRKSLSEASSVKLAYRLEMFDLSEESYAPPFFREQCGKYSRSNVRVSYMYDTRDALVTPRKGGHFDVSATYSGPGSSVQTYGLSMSASAYYNSVWDTIFSVTCGADTIETVRKNKEVPLFERCYLGGPYNLRGFRYRDVGMLDPALAGNETMGGSTSAYVQLEATVPMMEAMRFAVFMDAGFVNKDSFDFRSTNISADYGFGLRLNLPMGPLAVDYAIPFRTGNAVKRSGQFQFYMNYKY